MKRVVRPAAVGNDRLDGEVARRLAGGDSGGHPLGFEATAVPLSACAGIAVFGRRLPASGLRGGVVRSRVGAGDVSDREPMLCNERAPFRNRPRSLSRSDRDLSVEGVRQAIAAASSYSPSRVLVHLNARACRRLPEVRMPSQSAALICHRCDTSFVIKSRLAALRKQLKCAGPLVTWTIGKAS